MLLLQAYCVPGLLCELRSMTEADSLLVMELAARP